MSKVKSFRSLGKQQAYDLEVAHPDHQFYLANGLLTSNSHALSYAIDSFQCAYLLTYHEEEWLRAYMETQDGQPEKRAAAIRELRSLGYEVVKVDINHASDEWTVLPGRKFMPALTSIKGIGDAAIPELKMFRPYKTVDDLLWNADGSWRHSKFNKRALENLIKLCAFDSMDIVGDGKTFRSYHHMWRCLTEDTQKLKHKKNGRAELQRRIKEWYDECPEWSKDQLIKQSKELVGSADMGLVISTDAREWIEKKLGVKSIDDYESKGVYWFIIDTLQPKTTKGGKEYMLANVIGSGGKTYRLYIWGFNKDKHRLSANVAYVAEIESSAFGFGTQAFKMRRASEKR